MGHGSQLLVDLGAGEIEGVQVRAGGADGHHLGVRGGIVGSGDAIEALSHHATILHDDRAEGAAVALHVLARKLDGAAHEGLLCVGGHGVVPCAEVWRIRRTMPRAYALARDASLDPHERQRVEAPHRIRACASLTPSGARSSLPR